MRLLTHDKHGKLVLKTFDDRKQPPYAILSHTWHPDNSKEVTLHDLQGGHAEDKSGYEKIRFCEQQAKADRLDYFWIDTCCTIQSHHRYLCPTKGAAYAAKDGGRMYIAIQYKCSDVALLSHFIFKEFLFQSSNSRSRSCKEARNQAPAKQWLSKTELDRA
jgi:hypothetical protein